MHPVHEPRSRPNRLLLVVAAAVLVFLALALTGGSARADGCSLLPQGSGTSCANASLSMANLNRANLQNFDLSGANLSGALLVGADLTDANLTRADLSFTNLLLARLNRANLIGANLTGANLTTADLRDATLFGTVLVGTRLNGANLDRAILNGAFLSGTDLTNADLTGVHMDSLTILSGVNLSRAHLDSAFLHGVNFTGTVLKNADLTAADLSGANLISVDLTGANLDRANLSGANLLGAICPDGTVNTGNANGCAGHLTRKPPKVGTPTVAETRAQATAGQALDYTVGWEVTEPLVWRDLDSATVTLTEIPDSQDTADPAPAPFVITLQVQPGDASTLAADPTDLVQLNTDSSTITGSGPTGRSVMLDLNLLFAPEAAGKAFSLSIGVQTTAGDTETFDDLGVIVVLPNA